MPGLSTHVLDTAGGAPARGVLVALARWESGHWVGAGRGETDADGRLRLGADLPQGVYRLTFGTGAWFEAQGKPAFYPEVSVHFDVQDDRHHHIPLLLSPFGYSTYRGS